jgi:hypothetical protein
MDVGSLKILDEAGNLRGHATAADLNVEEHDPSAILGPTEHLLNKFVRLAQ